VIDETLLAYEEEPLEAALHQDIREMFRLTCSDPDVKLPAFEEAK
jgi:hypothetical protein